MQSLPNAFSPFLQWPQFILYKLVPSKKKPGKLDKLPVAPFDRTHDEDGINSQNRYWWVDINTAINQSNALGAEYGVAFAITKDDPFFLLDIDHCANPDGTWSALAQELLGRLSGACVEVSQSGTGLHILGCTHPLDHGCKNENLKIELYTHGRFVALTGNQVGGNLLTDCTESLATVAAQYFKPSEAVDLENWTTEPREDWLGHHDDDDLIEHALRSNSVASAFGGRATFRDLWECNAESLAKAYPDDGRDYNASRADAGLAQHLAFWTGCDCERIERLMNQSALKREKWEEENHATYLRRTIIQACQKQEDVHKLKQLQYESVESSGTLASADGIDSVNAYEPELVSGYQILGIDQQLEHFKGCVYVQFLHQVLTPDGELLKPDQFKATFGGYYFTIDATNGKPTKNAWEAFVESRAIRHLKVHRAWFRPDLPFGHISDDDGKRWVNTYKPVQTACHHGDVTPFLDHLALLLPDPHDREILLAYMAAIIQHKGSKFQWAPLIQGVEGNGKTLFSRVVEACVSKRYSHMPPASEIGEKFNDWLFDKVFIGVEDIYVPEQKRELIEVLKPMITSDRLAERAMQRGQVMKPVCANFIFNSNYKDAVRKTRNDRRFAIFYTAQQTEADVMRDMPDGYFPKLYDWLRDVGYGNVHYFLANYKIPASLNPAVNQGGLAARAPKTSSTDEAVAQSFGRVEQEVIEAIDEGRPGFAGGWVSSNALDRLLDEVRAADKIPRNKRRDMMEQLGYVYHPALPNGRTGSNTQLDGNRPRLYVKEDSLQSQLRTNAEVVKAYDRAQTESAVKAQDPAVAAAFGDPS